MTDLRPDEIQVIDDGAPVKINALHLVRGTAARTDAGPAAKAGGGEPLRDVHLISIVFDRLGAYSAQVARTAALEMIKTAAGPNVYFSVWQIGARLQLRQPFTAGEAVLKRAVDLATSTGRKTTAQDISKDVLRDFGSSPDSESPPMTADASSVVWRGSAQIAGPFDAASRKIAAITTQIMDRSEEITREMSARPSINGLLALVKGQGTLSGRKTILYLSDGLQMTSDARSQFQSIIGAANKAGVSIYTVDTSGLSAPALSDASQIVMSATDSGANGGPAARMTGGDFRSLRNLDSSIFANQQSPMMELAKGTGGVHIGGLNDLRKPIRRIAEDVSVYYEATYSPHITDYDGHFRKIAVNVARPHVQVQSRSGYFSLPSIAGSTVEPFEVPILKLLDGTAPAAGAPETFPLRAHVLRFGRDGEQSRASLVVEVPLSGVTYHKDEDSRSYKTHLSLVALVRGAGGHITRKLSQDLALQGAIDRMENSRSGFFTFQRPFTVAPGDYRVDIAVADRFADKVSFRSVECSLSQPPDGLALSDFVVVRRLEPLDRNQPSSDPLQYNGRRVVPDLAFDRNTAAGSELPVFFSVYPDAKSAEKPRVELELVKDKDVIGSVPIETPAAPAGAPLAFATAVRTAALPAGSYQLVARVTQADATRQLQLGFVVAGRPSPGAPAAAEPAVSNAQPKTDFLATPKLFETAQPPDEKEIKAILAAARQRALDYTRELPNFVCMQVTRRSVDPAGRANWKYRDTVTKVLRFVDGIEQSDLVEVNGQRAVGTNVGGIVLSGEFGGLLGMVFAEEAQPEVQWQGITEIAGVKTHVVRLRVSEAHSGYRIVGGRRGPNRIVAYTATVYIDAATMKTRRISIEAENVPPKFPIQESVIAIDYDEAALSGRDYLLPQQAVLFVREGAHYLKKNEIRFLNYRKFGAESTFKTSD